MPIAFTSRIAYAETIEVLGGLQRQVFTAIGTWPGPELPSIAELAIRLARKEGSICGRLDELRKLGLIENAPLKVGTCGKLVMTYRVARDVE